MAPKEKKEMIKTCFFAFLNEQTALFSLVVAGRLLLFFHMEKKTLSVE